MLIEFSTTNFRSFKDKQTLSMVAANISSQDKRLDEENVFRIDDELRLLKSATLYGANASGKSNLIKALRFMQAYVLNSSKDTQSAEAIPVDSFRLSTQTISKPSIFEIIFLLQNRQYRYGFAVDRHSVVEEWLFHTPTTREAKLFERKNNTIQVSSTFKEGRELEAKTRDNALFLSVVAQFNGALSQTILRWFRQLQIISGLEDRALLVNTMRLIETGKYQTEIINLVKQLDLSIHDLSIESIPITMVGLEEIPDEFKNLVGEVRRVLERREANPARKEIRTHHRIHDAEGTNVGYELFDMNTHESEGTKKIIALAGSIVSVLKEGTILVIDEFDARLHPLMIYALLGLFNSNQTNSKNAQLVITTHDTNLLNKEIFRRDQIWFAEKDRFGATHLYSLVEYKVRNDASFESNYIQGRYGAIPFIGNIHQALGVVDA